MEVIMTSTDKTEVAVFRYGIISPLLHRDEEDGTLENELIRLASKTFLKPDGRRAVFSPETLRKWLYRYRHGGLPALEDAARKNLGTHDAVPRKLEERLFSLRQEHPRWTVSRILTQLIEEKLWDMRNPSRSTLYRFAGAVNLQRDPHLTLQDPARPFEHQAFGQLWIADFLHGPKIRINGQKRKTYLHAIIDDATRYVVRAGFSTSEDTEIMMKELMDAIRTHGKPLRFYTDNGACYKSKHLLFVCANLGIQLIHTPPGKPRGRGKVERFFRTVRDGFLDGETPPAHTLEGLNIAFKEWLSSYHTSIHSSLGASPLQKRLSQESACKSLPATLEIEPLFRMKRRLKVYLDNTIRFKRQKYEVMDALPGHRVDVWFIPWDLAFVWYGPEMKPAKPVDLIQNAQRNWR
jgi:transposase InsO family protein